MPSQNFRVKNGLEVGTGVTISDGIINATSIVVSGNSASTFPQLIVSGVSTFTGPVSFGTSAYFGDNDKLYFGDGNDLEIYHSGTTSFILDNGTGNLALGSNGDRVSIVKGTGSETLARFNIDGAVELYHDNSKKFETLGAGVTVTGTTFTSQLNVSGVTTASSFIKSGGTSSQFLKADGSVDSSTYLTSYTETSTLANVTSRGNSTSNGISVGVVTATSVNDSSGNVRAVPQNSQTSAYILAASDVGKHISITTGGVTVNSGIFSAGDTISIYNNSGSNQTITQGTSVTMYLVGTATTGNRTLAQRGVATILCVASNTFVIMGGGLT